MRHKKQNKLRHSTTNHYQIRRVRLHGREYLFGTRIDTHDAYLNPRFWPADVPLQHINLDFWPTRRSGADLIHHIWNSFGDLVEPLRRHGYDLAWIDKGFALCRLRDLSPTIEFGSKFTHLENECSSIPGIMSFPFSTFYLASSMESVIAKIRNELIMCPYPSMYMSYPLGVLFLLRYGTELAVTPMLGGVNICENFISGPIITKDGLRKTAIRVSWPPLGCTPDNFFSYTQQQWEIFALENTAYKVLCFSAVALVLGTGNVAYNERWFYADHLSIISIAFTSTTTLKHIDSVETGLIGSKAVT